MGFSLKANKRKHSMSGCPNRDHQFKYIASQKQQFITAGMPIISIDTKKKELIGDFRNKGKTWRISSNVVTIVGSICSVNFRPPPTRRIRCRFPVLLSAQWAALAVANFFDSFNSSFL
jgi:Rhodopirellula transposase DDE domain